jgi:chaperonin cofactor prefoldin
MQTSRYGAIILEAMTKSWTDERLGERFDRIDHRFDRLEADVRELRGDFRELRGEMNSRFDATQRRTSDLLRSGGSGSV